MTAWEIDRAQGAGRRSGVVSVRVAASTSNLGPGFDFLGLTLGLFLHLEARPAARQTLSFEGPDGACQWSAEHDLILRTLRAFEAASGVALGPLEVRVTSEIPIGRGFGSSGAAVAAALLAAATLAGYDAEAIAERRLLPLALSLEGHPDNGSASLLGGCTLSVPLGGDELALVRQPVHPSIAFAAAWPLDPLFTDAARAVLPKEVPFADAVENPRRLALLLDGLRHGHGQHLALGTEDRLHERHRRALIPGSDEACRAAVSAGAWAAVLSGAGSGLVAMAPREHIDAVAKALAAPLSGGQGRPVDHVPGAPAVRASES